MSNWKAIPAERAQLALYRDFLHSVDANKLLATLQESVPWRQDTITIYGKTHNVPRLQAWYGDSGCSYTWSGIKLDPLPFESLPALVEARRWIQHVTKREFNSVLLNFYQDGNDTVGYHADDEPELGPEPFIASLSLGVSREFLLRFKQDHKTKISVDLTNGSLFVMAGETQQFWEHSLPRRKRVKGLRINLTWRNILDLGTQF